MDGFTYYSLFETKGIEYLIIIAFLVLIIPFWLLINRPVKITGRIKRTIGILTAAVLKVPGGVFYSKYHTWTHLEKSGNAKVGLDDLLLHLTGEVNLKHMKAPGTTVTRGEVVAEVEQNGKTLSIVSPISGELVGTNRMLNEEPGLLNEDPYGKGWICKIKPTQWVAETSSYHLAEEAGEWFKGELTRFKDFLAVSARKNSADTSPVYMQDGGELADNALASMPGEVWSDFQESFLK
jgi:glycine cleavage system H protein